MNTKLVAIALVVFTSSVIAFYPADYKPTRIDTAIINTIDKPRIQIALLLDTSSSMSGLINQTRDQLWQIVNTFAHTTKNGLTPQLEVAIYEYGNSSLPETEGYVRRVSSLTTELDQVSESLFSLRTNGGNEYCGFAIQNAVNELAWSQSTDDIRAIFIAGNEPFSQGPVAFEDAIANAIERGITVNTIHAGANQAGIKGGWQQAALLAGGDYMHIDHNHRIAHIVAPQDEKLAELNRKLNQTYVPYGASGQYKHERQAVQDSRSEQVSPAMLAKRATSKASSLYNNSSWDLVDALKNDKVKIEGLEKEQLPEPMRDMNADQRRAYVADKTTQRNDLIKQINQLSEERQRYIEEQKIKQQQAGINTIDEAITKAIRKQAASKNYVVGKQGD